MINRLAKLLPCTLTLAACSTPAPGTPEYEPPPLRPLELRSGYPEVESCLAPAAEPTHLVVTSTDFSTGAVGLVDLATRTIQPDLALASTDAHPLAWGERVFVINRFGYDWIDELDPRDELSLVHEFPLVPSSLDVSANPYSLALDGAGRAWISLFGAPELQVWSVPGPSSEGELGPLVAFDLSAFSDVDGIPELSAAIRCGELLFVGAERIDRSTWLPVDDTLLVPISTTPDAESLFDFEGDGGPDAIHLLGTGVGAWRLDPADPSGRTILLLNTGLQRINLATGTAEWVVDEQIFVDAGFDHLQLAGFDLDAQGRMWLAAASSDFSEYGLYRIEASPDPEEEPTLVQEVGGLQSVTGALEIVGMQLWFSDTTLGASGLRTFDLASSPITEVAPALPTGLPPMGLAPLVLE